MKGKSRLKRLSLYGLDLKEALHAMLSVDPRKIQFLQEETEEHLHAIPKESETATSKKGG